MQWTLCLRIRVYRGKLQLIKSQRDKRIKRSNPDPFFSSNHIQQLTDKLHSRGPNKLHSTNKIRWSDLTCWGDLGKSGSVGLMSFPAETCAPLSPLVMAERLCVRRQPYLCGCACETVLKWVWLWLLVWARARGVCHWVVCVTGWNWMWLWLRVCVRAPDPEVGSSSCSRRTAPSFFAAIHLLLWCPEMKPEWGKKKTQSQAGGGTHMTGMCSNMQTHMSTDKSCFLIARKTHTYAQYKIHTKSRHAPKQT